MAELTPNVGVGAIESTVGSGMEMIYKTYLRDLLIEKIDDPAHIYDDRILAMADGAAGLVEPWKPE